MGSWCVSGGDSLAWGRNTRLSIAYLLSLCYFTGESTLYPHCAVTKVVEDDAMACFMAHVHASRAVTAVAVVQSPIRPTGPQYNVT